MEKIAVTGGAGFVGTNLVRKLIELGHEVMVIDDLSSGQMSNLKDLNCEVYQVSICDKLALSKLLEDCNYIFHLAAHGSVPRSLKSPEKTFETNVKGTLNVIEIASSLKIPFFFSSSSSVYGANKELPKHEHMWLAPTTPYAASKLCGEALVHSYSLSFGITACTFRFFNIYGPFQRPNHEYAAVIPKWIWKAMRKEVIEVYGDGEQTRDFTYIDSVVSALVEVYNGKMDNPYPTNLAFGTRISLNQVLRMLSKHFQDLRVEYLPSRPGDIKDSQNDSTEIIKLLPGIEISNFTSGLSSTIEWFDANYNAILNTAQASL